MPCQQDNFDDVWIAFDKTAKSTETFRVKRVQLDDLVACAVEHGLGKSDQVGQANAVETILSRLLAVKPRADSTTYEVSRAAMWEFLRDHHY